MGQEANVQLQLPTGSPYPGSYSLGTPLTGYVYLGFTESGISQTVEIGTLTTKVQSTSAVALAPPPTTVPSGIVAYVPITITNSQTVATPAPFQQMIQFSESSYSNYITYNGNIANFEFFTQSGSIIPAWIESNNSGTITVWLNLANGVPASNSITVYLGFASKTTNLLSSSGTTGIGEAPQLSSTYAQYDDGASVFNFYDNFAGTSLNTNKWVSYGSPVITVNNGLTLNSGTQGAWEGIYTASSFNPQTNINDFDAYFTGLFGSGGGPEQTVGWQPGGTSPPSYNLGDAYSTTQYDLWNYNGAGSATYISGGSTTAYQIWSLWVTSTASYLSLNYGTPVSNTGGFTASTSLHTGVGSYTPSYQIKVQWFRLRAYPPNGVMPSYSFGSVS
jgi:hypothetical protein